MYEWLYELSPYYPIVLFVASALDIFFATGLFLYGAAMMSSVAMMHATGMITVEMIAISSYAGTMLGNTLNYYSGRIFHQSPVITKRLEHPKVQKIRHFLQHKGLFVYIAVARFVAVTRPLYALVLGSLKIKFHRFILYEAIIALIWIMFWLFILIQGEQLYYFITK
tara:strand:- start:1204 stop:1704 length:501 start_codon:yes stop_codon:yes gene_type:complete